MKSRTSLLTAVLALGLSWLGFQELYLKDPITPVNNAQTAISAASATPLVTPKAIVPQLRTANYLLGQANAPDGSGGFSVELDASADCQAVTQSDGSSRLIPSRTAKSCRVKLTINRPSLLGVQVFRSSPIDRMLYVNKGEVVAPPAGQTIVYEELGPNHFDDEITPTLTGKYNYQMTWQGLASPLQINLSVVEINNDIGTVYDYPNLDVYPPCYINNGQVPSLDWVSYQTKFNKSLWVANNRTNYSLDFKDRTVLEDGQAIAKPHMRATWFTYGENGHPRWLQTSWMKLEYGSFRGALREYSFLEDTKMRSNGIVVGATSGRIYGPQADPQRESEEFRIAMLSRVKVAPGLESSFDSACLRQNSLTNGAVEGMYSVANTNGQGESFFSGSLAMFWDNTPAKNPTWTSSNFGPRSAIYPPHYPLLNNLYFPHQNVCYSTPLPGNFDVKFNPIHNGAQLANNFLTVSQIIDNYPGALANAWPNQCGGLPPLSRNLQTTVVQRDVDQTHQAVIAPYSGRQSAANSVVQASIGWATGLADLNISCNYACIRSDFNRVLVRVNEQTGARLVIRGSHGTSATNLGFFKPVDGFVDYTLNTAGKHYYEIWQGADLTGTFLARTPTITVFPPRFIPSNGISLALSCGNGNCAAVPVGPSSEITVSGTIDARFRYILSEKREPNGGACPSRSGSLPIIEGGPNYSHTFKACNTPGRYKYALLGYNDIGFTDEIPLGGISVEYVNATEVQPPKPTAVVATQTNAFTLAYAVSWQHGWNGSAGTYSIQQRSFNNTVPTDWSSTNASLSFNQASGVVNQSGTYQFRVQACRPNGGCSDWEESNQVNMGSSPISVALAPITGAPFTAPATIQLAANVSITTGSIQRVEFYRGAVLVGLPDTSAPYIATDTGLAVGNYTYTARAYDTATPQNSVVSAGVMVAVNAPTIPLLPPQLAADPGTNVESDKVGELPGSFEVDASGAANYRIPIEVPPGRNGMQPNLAIKYNSNAGESMMGRGFALEGLSSITRCRQAKEHGDGEGAHPAIAFNGSTDRYCLDGERLLLVSGVHGQLNAEYRTEVDQYSRVKVSAIATEDGVAMPAQFTVDLPNGFKKIFGGGTAIRKGSSVDKTVYLSWALSSYVDNFGNAVEYTYNAETANGSQSISSLTYTGGSINFVYANSLRYRKMFVGGALFVETTLLEKINVIGLHSYEIGYRSQNTFTAASPKYVDKIRKCDLTLPLKCQSETSFAWADTDSYAYVNGTELIETGLGGQRYSYKFEDMDGNGKTDLFALDQDGSFSSGYILNAYKLTKSLSNQTEFASFGNLDVKLRSGETDIGGGWGLVDSRFIGLPNLIYYAFNSDNDQVYKIRPSTGVLFEPGFQSEGSVFTEKPTFSFSDFTGDGAPDTVEQTLTGLPRVRVNGKQVLPIGITGCSYRTNEMPATRLSAVDADSDGLSDLEMVFQGDCVVSAGEAPTAYIETELAVPTTFRVLLRNTGRFTPITPANPIPATIFEAYGAWKLENEGAVASREREKFKLLDINGDGLVDATYEEKGSTKWYFQLNRGRKVGNSYFLPKQCVYELNGVCKGLRNSQQMDLQDMDQDGYLDFLEHEGSDQYRVHYWNGSGFGVGPTTSFATSSSDWIVENIDMDGDGLLDNLNIKKSNGSVRFRRSVNHHRAQGRIISVTSGFGVKSEINYAPSTFADLYRRDYSSGISFGRANSRIVDISAPEWLVKRVTQSMPTAGNPNNVRSMRYRYVGNKVQAGGRGSLGMRVMEVLDEQKLIRTRTEFNQSFPLIGRVKSTQTALLPTAWPELCADPDSAQCMVRCASIVSGQCRDFDGVEAGTKILQESIPSYQAVESSSNTTGVKAQFVRTTGALETQYDLNTACADAAIPGQRCNERKLVEKVSGFINFDSFNYPQVSSESTSGYSAGGMVLTKSISNSMTYEHRATSTDYHLGLLKRTSVTQSRPAEASVTRVAEMEYSLNGALSSERIEPQRDANANLVANTNLAISLHTYHQYDVYGNRVKSASCSNHLEIYLRSSCLSTNANSAGPSSGSVSPEFWVRRFSITDFDGAGVFPTTRYAAFDNTSGDGGIAGVVQARNNWGVPTSELDAAGVRTVTYTGTFGAPYAVANSQGKLVETRAALCGAVQCPSGAHYRAYMKDQSGPDAWTYFDRLSRPILTLSESLTVGGSARFVATQTQYDALGRVERASQPYFAAGPNAAQVGQVQSGSVLWTTTLYDVLDRPTQITKADAGVIATSYQHYLTTTSLPVNTSGYAQTRKETRNALGEIAQVQDAAGLVVSYIYRATGELRAVNRPSPISGSISTSMGYDVLGRKTSMSDPDKGNVSYIYNPSGELLQETSPGSCTRMAYDRLGRMRSRLDFDACVGGQPQAQYSASWVYDSLLPGALSSEIASTQLGEIVSRTHSYDPFARRVGTSSSIEGKIYVSQVRLDEYSRPIRQSFVAQTDNLPELAETTSYQPITGIATNVTDASPSDASDPEYSKILALDVFGNVALEKRSAGTSIFDVQRSFYQSTGLAERIRAGVNLGTGIQDIGYVWDKTGNLVSRNDAAASLNETFSYDIQQRLLTQSTALGKSVLNMDYNTLGNITNRNGQAYVYGAGCANPAGPHAACKVGTQEFAFDARGNQITGPGRQVIYSPFDRAVEVKSTMAGLTSTTTFAYGPNRERLLRKRYPQIYGVQLGAQPDEVTHYLGETEIHRRSNGSVEIKRYVGGIIVKQQGNRGGSTIKREYQWFDHQGSVMMVSDLAGVPIDASAKMSYDGFGLRRESGGSAFSLASLIGFNSDASTRHGYTGHEMLDEAGLIHMNARLYDPQISRFIQADPLVQEPTESQSLNRYSYVMNNPLNATDPTGMLSLGGTLGFFGSIFGATPCPGCHGTPGHTQQNSNWIASAPGTSSGAFSSNTPTLDAVVVGPDWRGFTAEEIQVSKNFAWSNSYYQQRRDNADEVMHGLGMMAATTGACMASAGGCAAIGITSAVSEASYGNYKTAAAIGVLTALPGAASAIRSMSSELAIPGVARAAMSVDDISYAYTAKPAETYFRAMGETEAVYLAANNAIPAVRSGERMISPTLSYVQNKGYSGEVMQFDMLGGFTERMAAIGVGDGSRLVSRLYPNMPKVNGQWNTTNAYFKAEGKRQRAPQINIGIGYGRGLDTFNADILGFTPVR